MTLQYETILHRVVAGEGYPDPNLMVEASRPKLDEYALILFERDLKKILDTAPTVTELAGKLRYCINVTTHEETREELARRLGRFVAVVSKNAGITEVDDLATIAVFSALALDKRDDRVESIRSQNRYSGQFFAEFMRETTITTDDSIKAVI